MITARSIYPALVSVALLLSGCAIEGKRGTLRLWADYNSLRAPALFVEQLSHYPDRDERVRHLRWMYNKPPADEFHVQSVAAPPIGVPVGPLPPPAARPLLPPAPELPLTAPPPDAPRLLAPPGPLPLVPAPEPPMDAPAAPNSPPDDSASPIVPPPPAA